MELVKEAYGIDNLKLILKTIVNLGKLVHSMPNNTISDKWYKKLLSWLKTLFNSKMTIATISYDIYFIAENADSIKAEFLDLSVLELQELSNYVFENLKTKDANEVINNIPTLVDGIKALVSIYK